jgi:beta-galactosidase
VKLFTQYYRPPFPERARWREDLAEIKATRFDGIVLTASWAWIEPEPGAYDFDDHDELIELAAAAGLEVIVNVWSELQPVWVPRELPDSHMVDHMGHAVISSPLAYAQVGIMPGGCTDHPEVRARAGAFHTAVAERYAGAENLLMWDCWNEIRWASQADGYVCHCEHTLERFRAWLRERHGDLDGLNAAWRRRYSRWEDVTLAKLPTRTYSDVIAYQSFLAARASGDLRWRRDTVRAGDPERPIVAHTAFPSVWCTGEFFEYEPALARGNDFELADQVDGLGSSHFPAWIHTDPVDFGARLEASRSAGGGKPFWIAELQGGAAGHGLQPMTPVTGDRQARWIWNGVARGAKGVAFWCWRDEVFGRESGGFGIVGDDGHREDRLEQLRRTGALFDQHAELLDGYRPAPARVGVVLEPETYRLDWAGSLGAGLTAAATDPFQAGHSVQGYLRALERLQVPYDVVDPGHALDLGAYRALILPWPLIVDPDFGQRLLEWVENGGTLLVEGELDAFEAAGIYRYPDERPFASALGIVSLGRRQLDGGRFEYELDGARGELPCASWVAPHAPSPELEVLAADERGATVVRRQLGSGRVVAVGSFPALAYWSERDEGFEAFLGAVIELAGGHPDLRCDRAEGGEVQWRLGRSGDSTLLFVVNEGEAGEVRFEGTAAALGGAGAGVELTSGARVELTASEEGVGFDLPLAAGGYHLVRFGGPA